MKSFNVNIISTEMDFELFTNRKYYKKVYKAIQKLRSDYNITKQHFITCYKDYIVLLDQDKRIVALQTF